MRERQRQRETETDRDRETEQNDGHCYTKLTAVTQPHPLNLTGSPPCFRDSEVNTATNMTIPTAAASMIDGILLSVSLLEEAPGQCGRPVQDVDVDCFYL